MNEVRHRVAVTGLGAITALGTGANATFANLIAGNTGIGVLTELGCAMDQLAVAAEIKGLSVSEVAPAGLGGLYSRADALALLAASEAMGQAGIYGSSLALAFGTTGGGVREATAWLSRNGTPERDAAVTQQLFGYPLHATAQRLASHFGNICQQVTFCSACSSSATAIAQAGLWIASGKHCRVLAGGAEALSVLTLTGFAALGATSRNACRPFDAERAGMSLGEGAAFLVLESEEHALARRAEVLAWLDGWSLGAEAHHLTQPEPSGHTATRLITEAIACARLPACEVGYYNAHGTGTVSNDSMEASALRAAFGATVDHVLVSSCKGQLGHTLGAAGAVEAVATVLALRNQSAPPTVGLVMPAADTELNHVIGAARPLATRHALSSSFGFGGLDVVLLFSHPDTSRESQAHPRLELAITAAIGRSDREPSAARAVGAEDLSSSALPPVVDPLQCLEPERSRRFDRLSALTCVGVERALDAARARELRTGLVVGNALGNTERLSVNLTRVKVRGPRGMPPAEFPHLVHSSVAGNASIYSGLCGPVTSVSDAGLCCAAAIEFSLTALEQGVADAMLAGVVEAIDDGSAAILDPYATPSCGTDQRHDVSHWFLLETAEQARRRGQPILARVVDAQWTAVWYQYLVEHRPLAQSCLVLDGVDSDALDRVERIDDWSSVRRCAVSRTHMQPSGASGLAVLRALELLESERHTDAIVISRSQNRTWALRLACGH